MKANGVKFASLGPFKVVFKPFTFQQLWVWLDGCERGKTAPASAGSSKFALATKVRVKSRTCERSETGAIGDTLADRVSD